MTRNRIAYGILLGVTALLYYVFKSKELSMLFFGLLFLPIFTFFIALYHKNRLHVSLNVPVEHIRKGESARVSVLIDNRGFIPCPYLDIEFAKDSPGIAFPSPNGICSVMPNRRINISFSVFGKLRGKYAVGTTGVYVEDFLRIIRLECASVTSAEILVMPAITTLKNENIRSGENVLTEVIKQGNIEDYSSVADINPYDPSREFRKIHWKMTARMGEFMVREFETEDSVRDTVLLDLSEPLVTESRKEELRRLYSEIGLSKSEITSFNNEVKAVIEDKIIEVAVSMLRFFMIDEQPTELLYSEERPAIVRKSGDSGFDYLYRLCAGLDFGTSISVSSLISYYLDTKPAGSSLTIITQRMDDDLLSGIGQATSSGFCINVYLFLKEKLHKKGAQLIAALEKNPLVRVFVIEYNKDIKTALSEDISKKRVPAGHSRSDEEMNDLPGKFTDKKKSRANQGTGKHI